jgi:hypothetical protein
VDESVSFALTREQQREISALVHIDLRAAAVLSLAGAACGIYGNALHFIDRRDPFSLAMAAVWVALIVFWTGVLVQAWGPPVYGSGTLTLSESGLSGVLDGTPVTVSWARISEAKSLPEAIALCVVSRRVLGLRYCRWVALPKSQLRSGGASLWNALPSKFLNSQGLVLGSDSRLWLRNEFAG